MQAEGFLSLAAIESGEPPWFMGTVGVAVECCCCASVSQLGGFIASFYGGLGLPAADRPSDSRTAL